MHLTADNQSIKMTNNSSSDGSHLPAVWLLISDYESHFVGSAFALTGLLSLGFLFYLFHHRASNQMGGLLSAILIILLLFCASRSLLIVNNLVPAVQSIIANLDALRIQVPSITTLFALLFVAVIRSSEPIFTQAYIVTKLAFFMCLLLTFIFAFTPFLIEKYYTGYPGIAKAVQAATGMYFMTVLFIMGLSYIIMLPKVLTMARNAKLACTAPARIISSALIGFLSAFLLIIYVLFLLLGFLLIQPGFQIDFGPKWKENALVLRQLQIVGTSITEALTTAFLAISTILLIRTDKYSEIATTSAPEMQGLLYPGRGDNLTASRQPIILGSGTNGYHTLSKIDHRHHYG